MVGLRLDGRRCLVTGAANGLGRSFCRALTLEGAHVAGLDREDMSLTAEETKGGAGSFFALPSCDVTDPASVQLAVERAVNSLGGLDVLVNNAGIYPRLPFDRTDLSIWREVMSVNLDGTFIVTAASLPHLRRSGTGRVLNIASAVVWLGPPNMVAYTASKAGVIGFTRALAAEVGADGVTVNAITPGLIPTDTAVLTGVAQDLDRVVAGQAIPRAQVPEDLTSALVFLCDEASAFVTGAAINVDGGFAKH